MAWAMAQDMHLVTTAGVPTHRDGTVLDLGWSNISAVASLSSEFNCTSDHTTIVGSVQVVTRPSLPETIQELHVRGKDLDIFAQYVKAWVNPRPLNNVVDIECQVSSLLEALGDARKTVGRKPSRPNRSIAPW